MRMFELRSALKAVVLMMILGQAASTAQGQPPSTARAKDDRATKPNSYYYYGPNNLYQYWNDDVHNKNAGLQRLGRDTWIHWTWGNQKFLRTVTVWAGKLSVPISVDFLRLLDSRRRGTRFRDFGLINEPNCVQRDTPDKYGFYLDRWVGDPYNYYPNNREYLEKYPYSRNAQRQPDDRHYGWPSGVIGLRLFKNPQFVEANWDKNRSPAEYFRNPGKIEPPYLVGFSCAFCHMGFDPSNPPPDPENPRWEHLAANIGNQYFREGEIILGKGRVVFGDKNPYPTSPNLVSVLSLLGSSVVQAPVMMGSPVPPMMAFAIAPAPQDPYLTRGLTDQDFLYHYAVTQQPGTSETSRISYDFINNPNTINPIYGLKYRPTFKEQTPWGLEKKDVWHILKDGADSLGVDWALLRVPINIGCEGDYWRAHLLDPVTGRRQHPVHIAELLAGLSFSERLAVVRSLGIDFNVVSPARLADLKARFRSAYGNEEFGHDLQEAWRRLPALKAYLTSYPPARLRDAVGATNPTEARRAAEALPRDPAKLRRGAELFDQYCVRCHSSNGKSALDPTFLAKNYLADEKRYSVKELGTNIARALGTNAIDADIWAEFSSQDYKALSPIGRIMLDVPVLPPNPEQSLPAPIRIEFDPPGGGRGYYRTPSLINLWATAPYLHNNSVGDYYVVKDDATKERFWVSTDGTRWRKGPKEVWAPLDPSHASYRIDVSVDGRLKMFEDGIWKLLTPSQRSSWVKRTSAESISTLIPDLNRSVRQFVVAVIRDVLQQQLRAWLRQNNIVELADQVTQAVQAASQEPLQNSLEQGEKFLASQRDMAREKVRRIAGDLFDETFHNLETLAAKKLKTTIPVDFRLLGARTVGLVAAPPGQGPLLAAFALLPPRTIFDQVRSELKPVFLKQMGDLDQKFHQAAQLRIQKGMPVNLYANLGPVGLAQAAVVSIYLRDDPRALAEALLQMSDCPDLVEDSGHRYGSELKDDDKWALIEFLKTF